MTSRQNLLASALLVSLSVVPALAPRATAADGYQIDPVHSSVIFRIKHLGAGYSYGRFNEVTGSLSFDEQNPANSALEVQLKTESVDTANAKRDQHLKGPDFFNAKEFPVISFKSRQVRLVKDQTYEVTGDLTLHGVTHPLTVQLQRVGTGQDPRGGIRTGFETTFSIKRSEFGMNFMTGGIGDDVWVLVGFEGLKQ